MKNLIETCVSAVEKKIDPYRRKFCFEIFGFDFLLDSLQKVHLIEVNTNPSLVETSSLLRKLIPRMLSK